MAEPGRAATLKKLRGAIRRLERRDSIGSGHPLLRPGATTPVSPKRVEELLDGDVGSNADGTYFCARGTYSAQRSHGSYHLSCVTDLQTLDLERVRTRLAQNGRSLYGPPANWVYLDCETTGINEDYNGYAFMIGLLSCDGERLRLRQYLMRAPDEERAMLRAVAEDLQTFSTVITYNGTVFDLPLLRARYDACQLDAPFEPLKQFDILYPARRLWKLRLERCRLIDLEADLFGLERQEDVAGDLVPYLYFEFIRCGDALRIAPIFHHNACDLLSLACLNAKLLRTLLSPQTELKPAIDRLAYARWSQAQTQPDAEADLRCALQRRLPEPLEVRAYFALAEELRKKGVVGQAVSILEDLAGFANDYRLAALERLAKYHEHNTRRPAAALACVERAFEAGAEGTVWQRRRERLKARVERVTGEADELLSQSP
jgi:uncharacterized protein YprB with RNaseH-like and TPR domain